MATRLPSPLLVMVVCHTDVVRPMCSGIATARITGPTPAAKKLVLDSSVPPRCPGGIFATAPAAPVASASDMIAPPLTRPFQLRCWSFTGISATTFFFETDTSFMPSVVGMPPLNTRLGFGELGVCDAGLAAAFFTLAVDFLAIEMLAPIVTKVTTVHDKEFAGKRQARFILPARGFRRTCGLYCKWE